MGIKVKLVLPNEPARKLTPPGDGEKYASAAGACPRCKAEPFLVGGRGKHVAGHDTYKAVAACAACQQDVGEIVAVVPTIFGLEEDERVVETIRRAGGRVF